jgi:hypothetical protein
MLFVYFVVYQLRFQPRRGGAAEAQPKLRDRRRPRSRPRSRSRSRRRPRFHWILDYEDEDDGEDEKSSRPAKMLGYYGGEDAKEVLCFSLRLKRKFRNPDGVQENSPG